MKVERVRSGSYAQLAFELYDFAEELEGRNRDVTRYTSNETITQLASNKITHRRNKQIRRSNVLKIISNLNEHRMKID